MTATVAVTRECGWCRGNGEVQVGEMSTNPFSGVPVYDPELDAYALCWHCGGTGEIEVSGPRFASKRQSQRGENA